jgi:flagellar biosynthetic protein FlhB
VLAVFGTLMFLKEFFYSHINKVFTDYLGGFAGVSRLDGTIHIYLNSFVMQTMILSLPLLIVAVVVSIGIDFGQTKMNVSFKRLKLDFTKLDPIKGLKNLITLRSLMELLKSLLKIIIVGYIVYSQIKVNLPYFLRLFDLEITPALFWLMETAINIGLKVGIAMLALGVIDYLYQWWEYERKIMMSRQEVKDEFKQTEGDPQFRGYIKEKQRKMAMSRMMQGIRIADVIICNPTHFAVAIKYDEKKNKSPVVLAKGQDYLALKIIEEAKKHDITITENPPLARGLYAAVEIGQEIPPQYYQAVAEVLAFVYKLKKRTIHR